MNSASVRDSRWGRWIRAQCFQRTHQVIGNLLAFLVNGLLQGREDGLLEARGGLHSACRPGSVLLAETAQNDAA